MRNQTYLPVAPRFKENIEGILEIQKLLIEGDYSPGLMLVILGGIKGVTEEKELLYRNLSDFKDRLKGYPIITMLSCIPCEELDLLNQQDMAVDHVRKGIIFARELPVGENKLLTFHLGSLVSKEEFISKTQREWRTIFFDRIMPALREVSKYAKDNGVEVKVETIPTPYFGDIPSSDERTYRDVKLNELRDPFYLTHFLGFDEIRESGLGICLDLCHNRTIYVTAKKGETEGVMYREDVDVFKTRSLMDDVTALESSDLVHLTDGDGIFSEIERTIFREGVTLGKGDIRDLREMINHFDNSRIPYVLEIDEEDYVHRPNTRASIEFLLKSD